MKTNDPKDKYNVTLVIRNSQGLARVTYEGVPRSDLLKDEKMAALLRLHDHLIAGKDSAADEEVSDS